MRIKTLMFTMALAGCSHNDHAGPDAGGGDAANACKVQDEGNGNAVPICTMHAPPDSFDPVIQWTWNGGDSGESNSYVNLTDDSDPRFAGPLDPSAPDLERALVSRHERPRGWHDPEGRTKLVAAAQHVPRERADHHERRVRAAATVNRETSQRR